MDPLDIVSGTADPAFATDELGRIVIWNRPAEKLLGVPAAQALGKPCHEVLCGRDIFGNRFCDEQCILAKMVNRHEALHHFQMEIHTGSARTIWASFSVIVVPGSKPSRHTLIHLLQPMDHRPEVGGVATSLPELTTLSPPPDSHHSSQPALTAREIEIVRLLADGVGTREIADSLFISVATARNHIQNILRKLDVHSKLEAVALALRNHLI